jgi:hypothetical protein
VDTVRPNTHTLTLDRLNEGNDYMFRIIAENDEGRSQFCLKVMHEIHTTISPNPTPKLKKKISSL